MRAQPAFTLADAAEITNPFVAAERQREDVRRRAHDTDAARHRGVSWSGMSADGPRPFRSAADIARDAAIAQAKAEAFRASPRGRFLAAVKAMDEVGYCAEADRLRGVYARSLADEREPLDVRAVGAALALLNGVPGRDARDAVDALAELLMAARPFAMAAE